MGNMLFMFGIKELDFWPPTTTLASSAGWVSSLSFALTGLLHDHFWSYWEIRPLCEEEANQKFSHSSECWSLQNLGTWEWLASTPLSNYYPTMNALILSCGRIRKLGKSSYDAFSSMNKKFNKCMFCMLLVDQDQKFISAVPTSHKLSPQ
jgi:hypothetical protein